jgi:ribosomal protein L13E
LKVESNYTVDASGVGPDGPDKAYAEVIVEIINDSGSVQKTVSREKESINEGFKGGTIRISFRLGSNVDKIRVKTRTYLESLSGNNTSASLTAPEMDTSTGVDSVGPRGAVWRDSGSEKIKIDGINGEIFVDGSQVHSSDERLKSNITPVEDPLDTLRDIRGVSYTRDSDLSYGVTAQDVQRAGMDAAVKEFDGRLGVDYRALWAPTIEGITALDRRTKSNEERIEHLEEAVRELREENTRLRSEIDAIS